MMVESPANSLTQTANVTVLRDFAPSNPDDPPPPPVRFEAIVVQIAEPIMELRSNIEVESNAALKIETPEALWLGEVETCMPEGADWLMRVRLRHVLRDFETLARLAERFGSARAKGVPIRA
jgi:hypothetical protein